MIHLYLEKQLTAEDGDMQLNINIDIEQGNFITIYGNSGAGKTSILRMLAGLLQPDKGLIIVNQKHGLTAIIKLIFRLSKEDLDLFSRIIPYFLT